MKSTTLGTPNYITSLRNLNKQRAQCRNTTLWKFVQLASPGDSRPSHLRHFLPRVRQLQLKFLRRPHLLIWLICGNFNVAKSVDAPGQPSVSTLAVKQNKSAARSWQSVEVLFLSDLRVQIRIDGKNMESLTYAELGFADGRTQNPNKAWEVLRVLAEQRGIIRDGKTVGEPWPKVEKRIQEIRKELRDFFGLSDDPIPFVEGTGYQATFKIRCGPSFHA